MINTIKMKQLIIPCLLTGCALLCLSANAQENKTKPAIGEIGLYVSPYGTNQVFWFRALEGAGGYDNDGSVAFGLNFIHRVNKWLDLETGVDYSIHHVIFNSPFIGEDYDNTPRKEKIQLISVPVTIRAVFLKYFFANGGLLLDVDVSKSNSIDYQTGIGTMFGLGIKYDFCSGLSVFINPYTKIHSLLPFSTEKTDKYHERVWENGIRIGLVYALWK